ncbi:UNVERIFIED_CONTAM: hypothetical protein GTU68_066459 [Idotea baltica]|nr:hypothetical protein [Idotea baltica]
MSVSKKVV